MTVIALFLEYGVFIYMYNEPHPSPPCGDGRSCCRSCVRCVHRCLKELWLPWSCRGEWKCRYECYSSSYLRHTPEEHTCCVQISGEVANDRADNAQWDSRVHFMTLWLITAGPGIKHRDTGVVYDRPSPLPLKCSLSLGRTVWAGLTYRFRPNGSFG